MISNTLGTETLEVNGAVPTKKISGGHLVAKALKAEGVDTIFTLCGGHIIDIYDGCIDEGIKIIDMRHEQVAAHAADGYARMTGNMGCAVVTAGPGTTNAITGVANAFRAESPMLLIGGQAGALADIAWAACKTFRTSRCMRPITKFATRVTTTSASPISSSMAARESVQRFVRTGRTSRFRATCSIMKIESDPKR